MLAAARAWARRPVGAARHRRQRAARGRGTGYDYVHVAAHDHSRPTYAEILPDEKGATCAKFLIRAAAYFAAAGIERIERALTDNAWAYRNSHDSADAVVALRARHKPTKPHGPWQNGKAEQFARTLAAEWAYQQVFTSNDQRARPWRPG